MLRLPAFSRTLRSTKTEKLPKPPKRPFNFHNSPNMQLLIIYFQGLLKFIKRHLLGIFSKQLNEFCLCYRHASFFPFFSFLVHFQRRMHARFVWNMIKQSEPLKIRYDTPYTCDNFSLITHVYMFVLIMKRRAFY